MDHEESLERALADLAILESAYAEEIHAGNNGGSDENDQFPLVFTLKLKDSSNDEEDAFVTMEFTSGYPKETGVQIVSYRARSPKTKARLDETVASIRLTALECLEDEIEGGLACCSVAFEIWNEYHDNNPAESSVPSEESADELANSTAASATRYTCTWFTGEPLVDKKSTFQAHVCEVFSEAGVREALQQLMDSNSKLHKASHNMTAYRLTEELEDGKKILKHDNDDDGEDAAGARLAHLLEMRKEDCVFVVVSRWYGGIKLGPKRFAHINNVARALLQDCHDGKLFHGKRLSSSTCSNNSNQ